MLRRLPAYWMLPTLLALALYAITIPGTYTFDDVYSCREDPRLQDVGQWGKFLYEGYFPDGADHLWRPLVSYSYAIEVKLHGDQAWPFHLVNVLLHGAAAGLVAAFGARLAGRRVGLIAGLLFAAHPVHVEAVAGIVGRAEEMALIGVLGTLLLFLDRPMTPRRALAIVGLFLFAACCKEQGLLVPLMLFAWAKLAKVDRALGARGASGSLTPGGTLDYLTPAATPKNDAANLLVGLLTLTMAAYIGYRNHILPWYWERAFLDPALNPLVKSTGLSRWLILLTVLGRYTELLFVPTRLSLDYGMSVITPTVNFSDPHFYVGCASLVVGAIAVIRLRGLPERFLVICFLLSYFMVSNVIMIGTIMGERLMYLPSAFLCVLIAMGLARLPRKPLFATLALVLTLAAVRTETYAYQWNTRPRLYEYAVHAQPKASMPYLLLAGEVSTERADALLARARVECPDAPQVWGKSAWCKIALGQFDEADGFALRSFKLRPGNSDAMGAGRVIQEHRAATQAATKPASPAR